MSFKKSFVVIGFAVSAVARSQLVQVSEQEAYRYGPSAYWHSASNGINGMVWTGSSNASYGVTNWMDFPVTLPVTGNYEVWVHVPDNYADSRNVPYEVRHAGGTTTIRVDQSLYFNRWVKLGTFSMYAGRSIRIRQTDLTEEGWGAKRIGFDDIRFQYVGATTQAQSVSVTNIQMVNASTMRVSFNATWSNGLNPQYRVTLGFPGKTVTIPGTPSRNGNVVDCSLAAHGVPKFEKNERIPVRVELISAAGTKADDETMELLLPVILIPGIATWPWGEGDGTFPVLENDLQVRTRPSSSFGPGLQLYGSTYPTLTTLTYNRNLDSFSEGATKLRNLIADMLPRTWASKVVLIGHSKGGLVARACATTDGMGSKIKVMIMANSPHTGSMQAIRYAPTFATLRPVYNWYGETVQGPYSMGGYSNNVLAALNNQALPIGPKYYTFFSETETTAIGAYFVYSFVSGLNIINGYGDGVVSNFSQKGYYFNMRTRQFTTMIPAFQNAGVQEVKLSGGHGAALERPAYRNKIIELCYHGLFAN